MSGGRRDAGRTFVIIQARMTSTRLPAKVLQPILGRPMLGLMIERLRTLESPHALSVATTDDGTEGPILDLCRGLGVPAHRGPVDDVLARYHGAAVAAGALPGDAVVRLTSDCPLICPDVTDAVIRLFWSGGHDYAANVVRRTYPRGLDTEAIAFSVLDRIHRTATAADEREHVTRHVHKHREAFRVGSLEDPVDRSGFRLTVDEPTDLAAVRAVFDLAGEAVFGYGKLAAILDRHPEIRDINGGVAQKA